jgi:branched-chain amino acid transport system permease protein
MSSERMTSLEFPSGDEIVEYLLQLPLRHQFGLLGLIGLVVLPYPLFPLQLEVVVGILFLMMFAVSWDLVSGYTGQVSFGHAMFFATGGYTSAVLNTQHGVNPLIGILIGTILAGLVGLLVGYPALRLSGPYLSLVTLVIPLIMLQLIILWNSSFTIGPIPFAPDGLGGRSGLTSFPQQLVGTSGGDLITVGGFQQQVLANYYLALALLMVILAVALFITRSNIGKIFTAIRENEDSVRFSGIDVNKYKLFAFTLSGTLGGLAGSVYVHTMVGFPQPDLLLNMQVSINMIIMAIIGGIGTIVGAAVGAFLFGGLEFALKNYTFLGIDLANLNPLPLVVLSIVVLKYMPRGIVPEAIDAGRKIIAYSNGEQIVDQEEQSTLHSIIEKYKEDLPIPSRKK